MKDVYRSDMPIKIKKVSSAKKTRQAASKSDLS
jgi:hypothetical protein